MAGKLRKVIGQNVQRLREHCGYTQEYLGLVGGLSQSGVSKIERGLADLDLEVAVHWAALFQCKAEDLLRPLRWSAHPVVEGGAAPPGLVMA